MHAAREAWAADSATASTAIAETALDYDTHSEASDTISTAIAESLVGATPYLVQLFGAHSVSSVTDTTRPISPSARSGTLSTRMITPPHVAIFAASVSPETTTDDTPSCSICEKTHTAYFRCPFISTERPDAPTVCPSDVLPGLMKKRPREEDDENHLKETFKKYTTSTPQAAKPSAKAHKKPRALTHKTSRILNTCFAYCEKYYEHEQVPCPFEHCPFATLYGAQNRHDALRQHIQDTHKRFPKYANEQVLEFKITYAAEMARRAQLTAGKS